MKGFSEPVSEAKTQWTIWENFKAHEASWGGMNHDPHDHCDALYNIPYVRAGLEVYQRLVPQDAGRVLEVGCAQGYILAHVGGPDTIRIGIDFNEDRINKGRAQYPDTEFIVGDIRDMDLEVKFDYILLPGVLEHIGFEEARDLIEKAIAHTRPGGQVIFDLPWWSGERQDFNEGIHRNPSHAWTCTPYRWDWLMRGLDVEQINLPGVPFYTLGSITIPEPGTVLVGCWGKIGDILHAMPFTQSLDQSVTVVYAQDFAAVGGILDLLVDIKPHFSAAFDYTSDGLGASGWDRVINCSHNAGRADALNGWTIFGWWDNKKHGIDFAAGCGGATLEGQDRYLHFKPGVEREMTDTVVFLSNCGDPAMRSVPSDWFVPLEQVVRDLGGRPVECSLGPICTGEDRREDLGEVVKLMAEARLIISLDTMGSALLAQSLGVPILRVHRGATRPSMTGPTDPGWTGHRFVTDKGHNQPPDQDKAVEHIRALWNWREENGTS